MTNNTQIHLLLLSELDFALRTNDLEAFKGWGAGGVEKTTADKGGVRPGFGLGPLGSL